MIYFGEGQKERHIDYQELLRKRDVYQAGKHLIPRLTIASYERAFEIEYAHHSTAIEGNTLTLLETKLVLEDGISVGGKNLQEIYEQVNHQKAFRYVKERIEEERADESDRAGSMDTCGIRKDPPLPGW